MHLCERVKAKRQQRKIRHSLAADMPRYGCPLRRLFPSLADTPPGPPLPAPSFACDLPPCPLTHCLYPRFSPAHPLLVPPCLHVLLQWVDVPLGSVRISLGYM